jgi:hypothetical protein
LGCALTLQVGVVESLSRESEKEVVTHTYTDGGLLWIDYFTTDFNG